MGRPSSDVVLLATCAEYPDGDEDGAEILEALAVQGVEGRWCAWDDHSVDWNAHLVVLRSTWDYTLRREEFLAWTRSVRRLVNPPSVVEWNSDKSYLRDLKAAGVAIVPTAWATPGEDVVLPRGVDYIIKPSIGAGSRGAGHFTEDDAVIATAHVRALHDIGRTVMIQPYIGDVDSHGETALIYLAGSFSHAISKAALLPAGRVHAVDQRALYVEETIAAREPTDAELAMGNGIVEILTQRFGALLYARVDLLPGPDGPLLIELELTEPSLFLGFGPGSADLFAVAVARRL
jgi:hypothetical protein